MRPRVLARSPSPDIDAVIDGDRRFFRRHPERRHRLRLAAVSELDQAREAACDLGSPASGLRHHVVVRRFDHARLRAFVQLGEDCDTDLPEEACAALWQATANPMRDDLERRIEGVDSRLRKGA